MNPNAGRKRARRLYGMTGACQECGQAPAVERHHRDGDTFNNTRDNIALVCRRCHLLMDGRLAALAAANGARTHCKHGHEFTPENTYVDPVGKRVCRECRRVRTLAYYHRTDAARSRPR